MKFDVLNRFSGRVQFTADIECNEDESRSVKIGLSVKWAFKIGAYLAVADLAGAYLAGAYLAGAYLDGADLDGANLDGANLDGANLTHAYLPVADLAHANLAHANLAHAYLVGANLAHAYLVGANLAHAYLPGANLARANFEGANLARANLDGANLIVGGQRSDGWRFLLLRETDGSVRLRAGCRYFSIADARSHWNKTRAGTRLGDESLALVDDLERRAKIAGWLK